MLRVGLGRITPVNARATTPAAFLLNFADLGAGAVSLVEGAKNTTPTFTRATAGAAKLSTGLWKLDVASGTARYTYNGLDTTVTTTGGYFAEGARTNSVLQSRDLTNAAWTKSNLTTAKTSVGIDGGVNSCTRCTASAGNGTALQAVTLASAAKAFGVWIKRITGVGEIDITLDNGSTWTNITASINAATFTLVQATQTLANPTVGIRIVTNADAIDVDVAQLEDSASFSSSPIPTTVAAVTRNADSLVYPFTIGAAGSVFVSYRRLTADPVAGTLSIQQAAAPTNNRIDFRAAGGNSIITSGGAAQANMVGTATATNVSGKAAIAFALNDAALSIDGALSATDTSVTLPVSIDQLRIGSIDAGANDLFGTISSIRYFPIRLSNSVLQQITT